MKAPSPAKLIFVLSVAALSLLYGFAARELGWFPSSFIEQAWLQARASLPNVTNALKSPAYLHDRVHEREGVRMMAPRAMESGVTLISARWNEFDWNPGIKLVDAQGHTLHQWRVDPERLFSESTSSQGDLNQKSIHGTYLLPNGDIIINLDYEGTARLDGCGQIVWLLPEGNHHSIVQAADGSFWVPAVSGPEIPTTDNHPTGFPGLDHVMYHDKILNISSDGDILQTIYVLDIIYENGLERLIPRADQETSGDVTHLNDVEPLDPAQADDYPLFDTGDLLVSLRNLNLVMVFDPTSRRVKWHSSEPFIAQHDPDFLGGGWIGVFDNNTDGTDRGSMLGGSRVVLVRPGTNSRRILFPTAQSDPFYTRIMGKWQLLENGNLLLTESVAGRVVEVSHEGRTVWEWVVEPYDQSRVPEVTEGTRYTRITPSQVAGWPCSRGRGTDHLKGQKPH